MDDLAFPGDEGIEILPPQPGKPEESTSHQSAPKHDDSEFRPGRNGGRLLIRGPFTSESAAAAAKAAWERRKTGLAKPRANAMLAETRRLARELGPACVQRLWEIAEQQEDIKAAVVAANALLDRGFGKPKVEEAKIADEGDAAGVDEASAPMDWSKLSSDQLEALLDIRRTLMAGPGHGLTPRSAGSAGMSSGEPEES